MATHDDIVITGIGVVSPIGVGREAFWESLISGTSGIRPLTGFDASGLAVRFGGQVVDFDPKLFAPSEELSYLLATRAMSMSTW